MIDRYVGEGKKTRVVMVYEEENALIVRKHILELSMSISIGVGISGGVIRLS